MRRKAIVGVAVLVVAAIVWMLWSKTRGGAPAESAQAGAESASAADGVAAPHPRSVLVKPDPIGTLRLEGQVIDAKDSSPIGGATVTLSSEPPRTATTEADGSFAFDGLLARRYRVSAWKDAMYADEVDARVTATSEPVVLRMKLGNTIDVAVTAGKGGPPIAGAHVVFDHERSIDTDARGIAEVRGVGTFFHVFEVTADGWAPAGTSLMLNAAGGKRTILIALSHGAALVGTVVDPSGHPVTDADVSIRNDTYSGQVATDAAGAWRFPVLAAGHYELEAESETLAPSNKTSIDVDGAHDRTGVVLHMSRGIDIAGNVVDDKGTAVGNARVFVQSIPDWSSWTNADAQGHFAFRGEPPRSFQVFATSDSRASPAVSIDGTTGTADLRLVIVDATIEGTVVDDKGVPVAEAEVSARPGFGSMLSPPGRDDISDSRGRFTLGPMPDGSYDVSAEWPGVGRENMYMHQGGVSAKPGEHDVKVVLPAAGKITGVVTEGGKPLAHYALALDNSGFFFNTSTIIDTSDGRFTRGAVAPDTWRVGIVGDDTEVHIIDTVRVEAGKTTDLGTIDLPPARHVHGRVIDGNGSPVAGADVLVGMMVNPVALKLDDDPTALALRRSRHTTTGQDGRFDVALPGSARGRPQRALAVTSSGGRSPEVAIPDGDADVVLQLAPSGAIAGTVRGGAGMVNVMARSDDGMGMAATDEHGSYRIGGLAPGHYTVTAMRMGASIQQASPVEVDVAAGATATADLAFPTGGVTLVVLGAHADGDRCFVVLARGDGASARPAGAAPCTARVELPNLEPDTYKLCVNAACRDVTITATPLEQTIDLSSAK